MTHATVCTTCPVTGQALYIADVKPGLLKKGAKGDWGYTPDHTKAARLTPYQAEAARCDTIEAGRRGFIIWKD